MRSAEEVRPPHRHMRARSALQRTSCAAVPASPQQSPMSRRLLNAAPPRAGGGAGCQGGGGAGVPLRVGAEEQQLRRTLHNRQVPHAHAHAHLRACMRCHALTHSRLCACNPAAFSCYVRSEEPEKGTDCAELFLTMQARLRCASQRRSPRARADALCAHLLRRRAWRRTRPSLRASAQSWQPTKQSTRQRQQPLRRQRKRRRRRRPRRARSVMYTRGRAS